MISLSSTIKNGDQKVKIIKTLRDKKNLLLALLLLTSLAFIYGCQCEGSIGNSSNITETVKTQSEIK